MSNGLYCERLNLKRLEDLPPDLSGLGADEIARRVARGFSSAPRRARSSFRAAPSRRTR